MFLFHPLGRTDGDLGVFSQFSNSSFISNTATEYGAAIGVTALNIFESKRETKPSEINEWSDNKRYNKLNDINDKCLILILYTFSSFIDNVCVQGGVVSFAYFPFLFTGRNTLQNSSGPAIMVLAIARTDTLFSLLIACT